MLQRVDFLSCTFIHSANYSLCFFLQAIREGIKDDASRKPVLKRGDTLCVMMQVLSEVLKCSLDFQGKGVLSAKGVKGFTEEMALGTMLWEIAAAEYFCKGCLVGPFFFLIFPPQSSCCEFKWKRGTWNTLLSLQRCCDTLRPRHCSAGSNIGICLRQHSNLAGKL